MLPEINIHGFIGSAFMLPVWLPANVNAAEPFGPTLCDSLTCGIYECSCERCQEMYASESAAECYAESAWLRAAESGYPGYDYDPNESTDPQMTGEWMEEGF